MTILVVGDANADLSASLRRYPAEGDDSAIDALAWSSGGAAVNVAAALATVGTPARLLARVGRDPAATVALRAARAAGADLGCVQVDERLATGLCFAAVSPGGERTFFSYRGANVALQPPDAAAALQGATWVHICGHALLEERQRDTALGMVDAAIGRGLPVSLDMCLPLIYARRAEVLDLLPALDVLFTNEPELRALTGSLLDGGRAGEPSDEEDGPGVGQWDAALLESSVLDQLGPSTVAVKLGERGCVVIGPSGRVQSPGFRVEAVDTTACGDAFAAGFIHAHLRRAPAERTARVANALGALVATRPGGADSIPSLGELRAFLAERAPSELSLLG